MRLLFRRLGTNDPFDSFRMPPVARRLACGVAYAALILFVLTLFIRVSGVNKNPDATLRGMVSGTAGRPYVYRMLLPFCVRAAVAVTPDALENRLEVGLRKCYVGQGFVNCFRVEAGFEYEGFVLLLLMLTSLIGYAVSLFLLSCELPARTHGAPHVAPVLGLLALPPFFVFGYIYDFPVLFLVTCCLYLLVKQRFLSYLALFAVACVNKETSVVLVVAYAMFFYKVLPSRTFLKYGAIQLALFLVVKLAVGWLFRDNPGTVMIVTAEAQFATLMAGFNYSHLLLGLFLFLAIAYRWSEKSRFLKQSLWMFVPLLLLFMLGSCPGEYRVFYEVLPVVVLLTSDTLVRAIFSDSVPCAPE